MLRWSLKKSSHPLNVMESFERCMDVENFKIYLNSTLPPDVYRRHIEGIHGTSYSLSWLFKDTYIMIDSFEEYLWVLEYGSLDGKSGS